MPEPALRVCSGCGEAKPISDYYIDKRFNIPFARCKKCHRKYSAGKSPQYIPITPERRTLFWSNVLIPKHGEDACWEWNPDKRLKDGYGKSNRIGNDQLAHRVCWLLTNGPIPEGMFVCHTCDNRACVRPDHLFLGSHQDNMDDMKSKGRSASGDRSGARLHPETVRRGEHSPRAVLTEADIPSIRSLVAAKIPLRRIARQYGVDMKTIQAIKCGRTWKHVP